ncbi:MAG: hypothetical protein E6767_06175 [Dysgonomonas sp.]|nr:hypothetical protein [Dysgonomonas sp.]
MKSQIKYIELKTDYSDDGPAWIAKVDFSKTGKTIYFNGRALKGNGHGYARDIKTSELFWISGVKKDGTDRHWAGNGVIQIDTTIVDEYLSIVNLTHLDSKKFQLVNIPKTAKNSFHIIENTRFSTIKDEKDKPNLEHADLDMIHELSREASYTTTKNGKKFILKRISDLEKNIEK